MRVEWSAAALADLDRFAVFLHDRFPTLAAVVAREIVSKTRLLSENPHLGVPIAGQPRMRQIVLQVLNAAYVCNIASTATGPSSCASSMAARDAAHDAGP